MSKGRWKWSSYIVPKGVGRVSEGVFGVLQSGKGLQSEIGLGVGGKLGVLQSEGGLGVFQSEAGLGMFLSETGLGLEGGLGVLQLETGLGVEGGLGVLQLEGGLGVFPSAVLSGIVLCSIDRSLESSRSLSCRRRLLARLATCWKGNGGSNSRSCN